MSLSGHIRRHVVGYVAVFLALTGSAHALDWHEHGRPRRHRPQRRNDARPRPGRRHRREIADGTLASADLPDQRVRRVDLRRTRSTAKVANGSLGIDELAPGIDPIAGDGNLRQSGLAFLSHDRGFLQLRFAGGRAVGTVHDLAPGVEGHERLSCRRAPDLAIESRDDRHGAARCSGGRIGILRDHEFNAGAPL